MHCTAATRAEYASLKAQLQSETFPAAQPGGPQRLWSDLGYEEQGKLLKDRLKKYCQRVRFRWGGPGVGSMAHELSHFALAAAVPQGSSRHTELDC